MRLNHFSFFSRWIRPGWRELATRRHRLTRSNLLRSRCLKLSVGKINGVEYGHWATHFIEKTWAPLARIWGAIVRVDQKKSQTKSFLKLFGQNRSAFHLVTDTRSFEAQGWKESRRCDGYVNESTCFARPIWCRLCRPRNRDVTEPVFETPPLF